MIVYGAHNLDDQWSAPASAVSLMPMAGFHTERLNPFSYGLDLKSCYNCAVRLPGHCQILNTDKSIVSDVPVNDDCLTLLGVYLCFSTPHALLVTPKVPVSG